MSVSASVAAARPFIQLVSFAAKDASARAELLSHWRPAFDYVKRSEVGSLTSTYEGFLPAGSDVSSQGESEQEILAWETYSSQAEFERVHMTSPEVLSFLRESAPLLARPTTLNFLQPLKLGFHTRGAEREAQVRSEGVKPFTLVVTFELRDGEAAVERFGQIFAPMATYVKEHESEALTYEAFRSLSKPTQIVIFERYTSEAFLRDVHWKSDAFAKLGAELEKADIVVSKAKRTYEELQLGVWGSE